MNAAEARYIYKNNLKERRLKLLNDNKSDDQKIYNFIRNRIKESAEAGMSNCSIRMFAYDGIRTVHKNSDEKTSDVYFNKILNQLRKDGFKCKTPLFNRGGFLKIKW